MSKRVRRVSILAAGAVAALGATGFAASLTRVAIIDIPGDKLEQFDIGYVDRRRDATTSPTAPTPRSTFSTPAR
jgi:hypothetical protein